MDFAKPHILTESVTTKSGIRPQDLKKTPNANEIDKLVLESSNKAASILFQQPITSPFANCDYYPLRRTTEANSSSSIISPNSLVVICESFDNLKFCYATPGETFTNRNGTFHHDDFIGTPYGTKVRSRTLNGAGFVHVLRPTVELWTRSLVHRTQIVYEIDASMVVFQLHLKPGCIVLESGTGSGSMSHALLRCISPSGYLHTYEFNATRVLKARAEFEKNGVGHLVTVHYRDVCGKKEFFQKEKGSQESDNEKIVEIKESLGNENTHEELNKDGKEVTENKAKNAEEMILEEAGGFGVGKHIAHAVFLDLPEPWLAIPKAAYALQRNGRIASYSPCIEQTQRAVEALKKNGFHSIRTMEVRLREYYVQDVELESPPFIVTSAPRVKHDLTAYQDDKKDQNKHEKHVKNQEDIFRKELDENLPNEKEKKDLIKTPATKKRKKLCARPFTTMRGHTAFLTFATSSGSS